MLLCPLCNSENAKKINTYTSPGYDIYHCVSCDGMFTDPMKAGGKEWYEASEWYSIPSVISEDIRWYEKVFLKEWVVCKGRRILNIGCGRNAFLKKLKEAGCHVTAVDINEKVIHFTKNILGIEDAYAGDVLDFIVSYKGEKFDAVVFFEVLEHLENPQDFVKNLKMVLKNDDCIVLSVPNMKRFLPSKDTWDYPPHHLTRWNTKTIRTFLKISGYRIEKIKISPLTAEDFLDLFRIYFGTIYLENKIKEGDKRLMIKLIFHVLFKFRVIVYNILAIILGSFIKTKGLNLYVVAKVKNI